MKNFKKAIIACICTLAVFFVGSNCMAASTCNSATVIEVGVMPHLASETASMYTVRVNCEDEGWDGPANVQLVLTSELGISGYAAALTALSSDFKVKLTMTAKTFNSLITRLKVLAPAP